jgi:hypothetical protein
VSTPELRSRSALKNCVDFRIIEFFSAARDDRILSGMARIATRRISENPLGER